jgi:hypothetical protein
VSPDWTIQAWSKNEANIHNIQHICPKSEDIVTYKGFFIGTPHTFLIIDETSIDELWG